MVREYLEIAKSMQVAISMMNSAINSYCYYQVKKNIYVKLILHY